MSEVLSSTVASIQPIDAEAVAAAEAAQAGLAKPAGALGVLETLSLQLSGIAGTCPPPVPVKPAVGVFAGDHGVLAQGVTPWPSDITFVMCNVFQAGGAGINVLARAAGASVTVVDMGVAGPFTEGTGAGATLVSKKVRPGTSDLAKGAAMSRDEAVQALEAGIAVAQQLIDDGADLLITGDMGIGNTTPSAALIAALTGTPADVVTGRGTGIDDDTLALKTSVVAGAVERIAPDADGVDVLAEVGGFEHAGIAGFVLGAAARRVPVILDGVIAGSAALVAQKIAPEVVGYCIAGHRSFEPGHRIALEALGLRPLLELDLRLGEGTGAALAAPIVQASARVLTEMATLESVMAGGE
ncbi:nicotinate-nucleotide--dimethylbenzimidazole phosphoribosyltransferase [Nocardioides jiangxiensis]|uniref:Nicotinate-nucleotide--dimethylbenzimidazole phosphoribosyltransferase n=1 Tax=Nocardioides jiangxiensis TaxID=3064524 RepID=A0ABT9B449_9ACTN|nr:nicotinate-nucleotide--dimethylbenzimidazole phosphoribosyltransferase [Nocardioides sp. WY-20]MDO7869622.1 nicotinate-nucleotide--dimethylbenzimidazole phosphoribosyltransferase [Nocardioides sp. WY-20]